MTDEAKRIATALQCCVMNRCGKCPYKKDADCSVHMRIEAHDLIERLSAELEAARQDLELIGGCPTCKFNRSYKAQECETCGDLDGMTNWQWRDPCAENGGLAAHSVLEGNP